jgi:hypothetical protein
MRYTGQLGRSFSGDKRRAVELQSRARVLVGRLLQDIKRQGGYGQKWGTEKQLDGSVIHAWVLSNIKGQQPIIRTWIESPCSPANLQPREIIIPVLYHCGFVYVPVNDTHTSGNEFTYQWCDTCPPPLGTDYWHSYLRLPDSDRAQPKYIPHANAPWYGNVDWVSDRGEVLSFIGPATRYLYWVGFVDPGTPMSDWDYGYNKPDRIFRHGQVFYQPEHINGCCLFRSPDKTQWLVFTLYMTDSVVISAIKVVGESVSGSEAVIGEIDCTWSDCPYDWYQYCPPLPRTITAFKRDGSEGAFVLCDGSLVRFSISGGDADNPPVTSIVEYTRAEFLENTERHFSQLKFQISNTGDPFGSTDSTRASYDTTSQAAFSFQSDVRDLAGSYTYDSVAGELASLYRGFTKELVISGWVPKKIPLAVDYHFETGALCIAYFTPENNTVVANFSVKTQHINSPNSQNMASAGGVSGYTRSSIFMPNEEEYVLQSSLEMTTSHSVVDIQSGVLDEEVTYYKKYDDPNAIRYMDLRRGCIFMATSQGSAERKVVTKHAVATPGHVIVDTITVTEGFLQEQFAILDDDNAPTIHFGVKSLESTGIVTESSTEDLGVYGAWMFGGEDLSGQADPLAPYAVTTKVLSDTTEAIEPGISYGAGFLYGPANGPSFDRYVYFGEMTNTLIWGVGTYSPQEIAYDCNNDRLVSIKDAFTGSNEFTTQLFQNAGGKYIPYEQYMLFTPDGTARPTQVGLAEPPSETYTYEY